MAIRSHFVIWSISWKLSALGWFDNVEVIIYTSILWLPVRSSYSRMAQTQRNIKRAKCWIC
jgi:hypothetical protein